MADQPVGGDFGEAAREGFEEVRHDRQGP
jgi:hypothetical protein